jgi:transcriptional regulator NrdR family protein
MGTIGTQIFCPNCKSVRICRAVSTTELGKNSKQRVYVYGNDDLQLFRRGRECQSCFSQFLTAELEEKFVFELSTLRTQVASQLHEIAELKEELKVAREKCSNQNLLKTEADKLRGKVPWLYGNTEIPYNAIYEIVARSAWWIKNPSTGLPVRAKRSLST